MDDDPLPSLSHATGTSTALNSPFLHPRFHALKSSSPPPLFSENDSLDTADVSNYESPREKRKRAGTWWQTELKAPKRRQFNRNFDSGVYMMSDDSQAAASDHVPKEEMGIPAGDILSDPPEMPWDTDNQDKGIENTTESSSERTTGPMSASEARLCRAVQHCLDSNTTTFIFGFGLQDHELRHLGQLNQIIHLPPGDDIEAPAEGQYRSMIPEIHLNLSWNTLRHLSPVLFQLQHLTTLALRYNCIESVPPQIKDLTSLQTLDLCFNSIRELPCELLALCAVAGPGRLVRLELAGNPIYEFHDNKLGQILFKDQILGANYRNPFGQRPSVSDRWNFIRKNTNMDWSAFEGHHLYTPPPVPGNISDPEVFNDKLFLFSRTAASYYDRSGRLLKGSPVLPTQQEPASNDESDSSYETNYGQPSWVKNIAPGPGSAPEVWFHRPSSSKVLSLATLSLVKAYQTEPDHVHDEIEYYNDGTIPPQVEKVIAVTRENKDVMFQPLRTCHCCGKDYIIPRAEWIEGWYFNHQIVPIKVAVCSWGCVPDIIAKKPEPLQLSPTWQA